MQRFVEFDFEDKVEREIKRKDVRKAIQDGKFVWVDVETQETAFVRSVLADTLDLPSSIVAAALRPKVESSYDAYPNCLHLGVIETQLREAEDASKQRAEMHTHRIDVLVGEGFLVTYSREFSHFLGEVRKAYRADFIRFAKSPSFLIYEIWDHLIRSYENTEKDFEQEVEKIQRLLVGEVNEEVFGLVSKIASDLLYFRKHLAPSRGVLTELSTRKSLFVSEATQPFLLNMVSRLERILADIMVIRDVVRDSLELNMSMVGYRTNQVMNRLTAVTILALPLTFLSGIYGMEQVSEFPLLPFRYFWVVVGSLTLGTMWVLKRMRLL